MRFLYKLAPLSIQLLLIDDPFMPIIRQHYLSADAIADVDLLLREPGVLALVAYGDDCAPNGHTGVIPIGMRSLSGKPWEVIRYGDAIAERGIDEHCHWSLIEDVLCVSTWIAPEDCTDIEAATEVAYGRLFRVIQAKGFPFPFRIWNFMPDINTGTGDLEEYKKFCVGRQRAFDDYHVAPQEYPAASALGHHSRGAVIYLLAGRNSGVHHENPRQQPAYQYPREYGPSSPSFARATSLALRSEPQVFISGTASIIGHNTHAVGDLQQQLSITLDNIQHLLAHVQQAGSELSAVRVYLRHPEDCAIAESFLTKHLPAEVLNFIHADICRSQLLVEIEALARVDTNQATVSSVL
jgi:chorismate lyase / 3-hydroxybenzoate synthase